MRGGRIVIVKRDGTAGASHPVVDRLTIGGSKDCDIVIRGVSGKICSITARPTSATIKRLSETTTTVVNGKSVYTKVLNDRDVISLDKAKFRWEYSEETPGNRETAPAIVRRTRKSIIKKRAESGIRQSAPMPVTNAAKTRQVAVVMPQRRHSSHRENAAGSNDAEVRPIPLSGKRKRPERIEKIGTPVPDDTKKVALMLLTGRSWSAKKNASRTPVDSRRPTGVSESAPPKRSVAKRPSNVRFSRIESRTPRLRKDEPIGTEIPKVSTPVFGDSRSVGRSSVRESRGSSRVGFASGRKTIAGIASTPKISDVNKPSASTTKRRSVSTPIASKRFRASRSTRSSRPPETPADSFVENENGGAYSSVIKSLTNALNILNDPEIDLEYVAKTPEYQAIMSKIASVGKLSNGSDEDGTVPRLIEIGRMKFSKSDENTPRLPSPIISGKYASPENLETSVNNDDMSTPNISILFESKSSTPKNKESSRETSEGSDARRKSSRTSRSSVVLNKSTLTPKSTARPPREVLKEKHSTAKKPISKKSIIDHLTRSPRAAKELFESPVKRVLSQSIKHYDSVRAFDDEPDVSYGALPQDTSFELLTSRRSSGLEKSPRNDSERVEKSIGASPSKKSPRNRSSGDNSLRTLFKTPKPRASSRKSLMNVSGIRALFPTPPEQRKSPRNDSSKRSKRKSPVNDLTDVTGVKKLFRSPRKKQNTPKNDLTDVAGVKELFRGKKQNSPRNNLTDVAGLKKLFCDSNADSNNDLTDVDGIKRLFGAHGSYDVSPRVSGVKNLFRNSPRNDLKEIGGIKKLFQAGASPANNLTDVEGVKALFRKSPRNSITDVDGVAKLLRSALKPRKSPRNNLDDVKGVKKLFRTPSRARKSPLNDLRDVRGVKKMLKTPRKSPKNDLSDLRGVRVLLKTPKKANAANNRLSDFEGVSRMLRTPSDKKDDNAPSRVQTVKNKESPASSGNLSEPVNKSSGDNESVSSNLILANVGLIPYTDYENIKSIRSSGRLKIRSRTISIISCPIARKDPVRDKITTLKKKPEGKGKTSDAKKTRLEIKQEKEAPTSSGIKTSSRMIRKNPIKGGKFKNALSSKIDTIKQIDNLGEIATLVKLEKQIKNEDESKSTLKDNNKKKVTFALQEENIIEKSTSRTKSRSTTTRNTRVLSVKQENIPIKKEPETKRLTVKKEFDVKISRNQKTIKVEKDDNVNLRSKKSASSVKTESLAKKVTTRKAAVSKPAVAKPVKVNPDKPPVEKKKTVTAKKPTPSAKTIKSANNPAPKETAKSKKKNESPKKTTKKTTSTKTAASLTTTRRSTRSTKK